MIWRGMTRRQGVLCELMLTGRKRAAIASELGISPKTFDTHRGAVLSRIGAASEVDALRLALCDGVVRVEPADADADVPYRVVVPSGMAVVGVVDSADTVVADVDGCTCRFTTGACEVHDAA